MLLAERLARIGNRILSIIAAIIILLLLLYGVYCLWDIYRIEHQALMSEDFLKYKPTAENTKGFEELMALNPDVKAWLTIDKTNIDYPVVQGKDDTEYLNKDPLGEFTLSGSIFLSYHNHADFSDNYNMTFGHFLYGGAMYGDLDKMLKSSYFEKHHKGTLYLPKKTYKVDLYAAVESNAYDQNIYGIPIINFNMAVFQSYIRSIAKSYRDIGITPQDKVIAMSTCHDAHTQGRIIVFGRLTETKMKRRDKH